MIEDLAIGSLALGAAIGALVGMHASPHTPVGGFISGAVIGACACYGSALIVLSIRG